MDRLRMHSPDLTRAHIERILDLFPAVGTESTDADGNPVQAIDFDLLKQELSDHLVEGSQERYQLDWPGKRAAAFAANAPIAKTLRPMPAESIGFDGTKNLFIEGDNLDALKLLQESYLGTVKMIYIDPPYNTGNDFVYEDDFAQTSSEYLRKSGQQSETGDRLVANSEANGRFHSDWLSLMYPRLRLARNLLTSDGFIVVSIDDAEVSTLELLLDEVMGAQNKIAVLVWDKNRKNDARYFSVGHEYMLVYARDQAVLQEKGIRLREPQAGLAEAREFYDGVVARLGDDWPAVRAEWRAHTAAFAASDDRKKLGRFTKVGPRGPFRDDGDISWPGGGGPTYDVTHPSTGVDVKKPAGGWVYPTKESFDAAVASGRVVFGPDESTLPRQVRYLFESPGLVMPSVQYSYAQTATVEFTKLMGGRVFDNPKNWRDLRRLIEYLTGPDDLILDFFAGSASTAHAVLDLNATTGSTRSFVLVQLDEPVAARTPAAAAGYATIPEISRERIRRVGVGLAAGDRGFRSFRIDTSNFADAAESAEQLAQGSLAGMIESVRPDRSHLDLVFELLLAWGLPLDLELTTEEALPEVLIVDDGALIACLADDVTLDVVRAIAARRPLRAVFKDSGFANDAARTNAEQIFAQQSPDTDVKVI